MIQKVVLAALLLFGGSAFAGSAGYYTATPTSYSQRGDSAIYVSQDTLFVGTIGGTLDSVRGYIHRNGTTEADNDTIMFVIYADNAGSVGALIDSTAHILINTTQQWYKADWEIGATIATPGATTLYWVGFRHCNVVGVSSAVQLVRPYDDGGTTVNNSMKSKSIDTTPDPFGTPTASLNAKDLAIQWFWTDAGSPGGGTGPRVMVRKQQ